MQIRFAVSNALVFYMALLMYVIGSGGMGAQWYGFAKVDTRVDGEWMMHTLLYICL